jgi:hypothetical protein
VNHPDNRQVYLQVYLPKIQVVSLLDNQQGSLPHYQPNFRAGSHQDSPPYSQVESPQDNQLLSRQVSLPDNQLLNPLDNP